MSAPANLKYNFDFEDSAQMRHAILNGGAHPNAAKSDKPLQLNDALTSQELGPLVQQSVSEMMVEYGEPIRTISPFYDRIDMPVGTHEYRMPSMGVIEVDKVAEGQAYPEKQIQIGGAMQVATVDKWGAALAITREARLASRWDLMALQSREIGRAFARRQEREAARNLTFTSQPTFDNRRPTDSLLGATSGRDLAMAQNGTMALDDIFDMYASVLTTGYQPNTLFVHPLTWLMFIKDPVLRAFAFQQGNGVIFGGFTGSPVNRSMHPGPSTTIGEGNRGAAIGQPLNGPASTNADFDPRLDSGPQIPSSLPYPMTIVVSPYMHYDHANKLTHIVMADSSAIGAMVVAEELTSDEWTDMRHDIFRAKFRSAWGFLMYEEGMGVSSARNVLVDTNYWTGEPARMMTDPTVIAPLDRTTSPL